MAITRVQYAQKTSEQYEERMIIHFETDSTVVLMEGKNQTLAEFAAMIDGKRTYTLSGGVTGTVEVDGHSNVVIETEVTDDSHKHTGATLDMGEADRVLITAEDGSVIVSPVTATELSYLSGVTSNIQEQLDDKVKASETNGNILLDGEELPVYVHPDKDDVIIPELDPDEEPTLLMAGEVFQSLSDVRVDNQGHLEAAILKNFKMPRYSQFFLTSEEPTTQVAGDFWLETLSVEVGNGEYYIENTDGDKGKTRTIGENSEDDFLMTDLDTADVAGMGSWENYVLL